MQRARHHCDVTLRFAVSTMCLRKLELKRLGSMCRWWAFVLADHMRCLRHASYILALALAKERHTMRNHFSCHFKTVVITYEPSSRPCHRTGRPSTTHHADLFSIARQPLHSTSLSYSHNNHILLLALISQGAIFQAATALFPAHRLCA